MAFALWRGRQENKYCTIKKKKGLQKFEMQIWCNMKIADILIL